MNIVERILAKVKALYSDLAYVWGKVNSLAKWDSLDEMKTNWGLLQDLATRTVLCVEYCAAETKNELKLLITSSEKKAAAVAYLDELIALNGLAEWLSDRAISLVVDAVVAMLNKKFGKDWGVNSAADVAKVAKAVKAESAGH